MKLDINANEKSLIVMGLDVLIASTTRSINTEKNEAIKTIRKESLEQMAAVRSKVQTQTEGLK